MKKKPNKIKEIIILKLKKYIPYGILGLFSLVIFTTIIIFNKNSYKENYCENYYLAFPILLLGYTTDKIIEIFEEDIDLENSNFFNPFVCLIVGVIAFIVSYLIKYIVFSLFCMFIYVGCIFSIIWVLIGYSLKKNEKSCDKKIKQCLEKFMKCLEKIIKKIFLYSIMLFFITLLGDVMSKIFPTLHIEKFINLEYLLSFLFIPLIKGLEYITKEGLECITKERLKYIIKKLFKIK